MRLITFAIILVFSAKVSADTCSITCQYFTSCSITGANVECWCHWWNGGACCVDNGVEVLEKKSRLLNESRHDRSLETEQRLSSLSFAQRGGNLNYFLSRDLFEFYNDLISELGFTRKTAKLIHNLYDLRAAELASDLDRYNVVHEKLEHGMQEFNELEKDIIAELALKAN